MGVAISLGDGGKHLQPIDLRLLGDAGFPVGQLPLPGPHKSAQYRFIGLMVIVVIFHIGCESFGGFAVFQLLAEGVQVAFFIAFPFPAVPCAQVGEQKNPVRVVLAAVGGEIYFQRVLHGGGGDSEVNPLDKSLRLGQPRQLA